MRVQNLTNGAILVTRGEKAASLWSRGRGLLGHTPLSPGEGMLIIPCHSVHTFFMGFAIDVVFLTKDLTIIHMIADMHPWRLSPHLLRAHSVLELPAGTLASSGTAVGDQLAIAF